MKKLLLIYFLCILKVSSQEINSRDNVINWSKDYKLNQSDFIQKPPNSNFFKKYQSETVSDIEVNFINTFEIRTIFYKNLSWIRKTKDSLNHEQLHFDITELFARKLRKEIYTLITNKVHDDTLFNTLFNEILTKLKNYQNLYDKQTAFSKNINKQKEWELRIANELISLENFDKDNYMELIGNMKCKSMINGLFKIDNKYGGTIITRKKHIQIEEIKSINYKAEFDVIWTSDCTYELRNKKFISGPKSLEGNSDIILFVRILDVNTNTINILVKSNESDFETKILVQKL